VKEVWRFSALNLIVFRKINWKLLRHMLASLDGLMILTFAYVKIRISLKSLVLMVKLSCFSEITLRNVAFYEIISAVYYLSLPFVLASVLTGIFLLSFLETLFSSWFMQPYSAVIVVICLFAFLFTLQAKVLCLISDPLPQ
jgi:hypothetical protein